MQAMIDIEATAARLRGHLKVLTMSIGERSVAVPRNLDRARDYIQSFYSDCGLVPRLQAYGYRGHRVSNIIADMDPGRPSRRFLLGAHYDSVSGTVGADDNASAVAVQLETARGLSNLKTGRRTVTGVRFVSFALEEPPVYGTRSMGSRVYAREAKKKGEAIDGMICLEMVGYTCREPGCQDYPFPLAYMGYPETGDFIGIVGNRRSMGLTRALTLAFAKNPDLPVVKLTVPFDGWVMPSVRLSDHASFWDAGYKAVMVTDSAFYRNPYYHTAGDTMEKLDYRFMAELVESLILFFLTP